MIYPTRFQHDAGESTISLIDTSHRLPQPSPVAVFRHLQRVEIMDWHIRDRMTAKKEQVAASRSEILIDHGIYKSRRRRAYSAKKIDQTLEVLPRAATFSEGQPERKFLADNLELAS